MSRARTPLEMATWSFPPVGNRQGEAYRDFSLGGGAAFHAWFSCYLGPQFPMIGQNCDEARTQREAAKSM